MKRLYKRMGGAIRKIAILFLPFALIFGGCTAFQSSDEASVSFVITKEMVQNISSSASRSASFSDIPEELLENSYIDIELKGGYSETMTVPVSEGASITFEGIPVGTSLYAEVTAYRQSNGETTEFITKEVLYKGKSEKITVSMGDNALSITMLEAWKFDCPSGFVSVLGATVSGAVDGSSVFIEGRTVTIPNMYVCDHEVTQGEYEMYCKYGGSAPSETYGVGDNLPAYCLSWYDGIVYCNLRSIAEGKTPVYSIAGETDPRNWTDIDGTDGKYCGPSSSNSTWNNLVFNTAANGYRLPTEAEWEYIARGGNGGIPETQYLYAGSDLIDEVAWYAENSDSLVHEAKMKKSNSLGIYDMSGNIYEWCFDWNGTISATTSATGSESSSGRVRRGASYLDTSEEYSKVAARDPYQRVPQDRRVSIGIRVVRTVK